jgi:predicted TIM-barrel fold metal-dependent hydrolase
MDELPIIDAHHHPWNLSHGPLYYPWLQDTDDEPHFLGDQSSVKRGYLPAELLS